MKVLYYENILNESYKTFEEEKGITINELVEKIAYPQGSYIISAGEETYYYPEDKEKVLDCDLISIKLLPEGKANVFNAILVVVGTVLCATGVGVTVGTSMIIAGVSGFIAQLLAPKTPNVSDYGENVAKYGVSGVNNQSNLGNCYPVVFGNSVITPPYVGNYYTTLSDNTGDGEQSLTVLLNCGYSPLQLKNFKIDKTLVATNNADVRNGNVALDGGYNATIEIRQDGSLPSIYNKKYFQEQIGSEIKYIATTSEREVRTTPKKTKKVRFDIKFNALYHQNKENGTLERTTVCLRYAYRKTGTSEWKEVGQSLKMEIYETTVAKNLPLLPSCKVYAQSVYGYEFTLNTNRGNMPGRYYNNKVQVRYANNWYDVVFELRNGIEYTAGENKTKRWYAELEFTEEEIADNPAMQWDICVWRTTPERDNYYQDKAMLESILYTIDDVPVIESERQKLCLVAFRIQASEYIQNIINKINVEATSILPVWNGDNWETTAPSSNPASCYLQAIKGNYLKKKATDNQIDYDALQELYEFCEAKGYYCNGVISNSETLKSVIDKILNTCRTEFSIKNGMYSCVIDDVRPSPIAIITPKNSSNFQFTKDLSKKVNAIKCTYQNKNDGYATTEEEIRLNGENPSVDDNIVSVNLWGVNNHEQAVKICRYSIASSRLRPETYTCKVSVEHFSLPKGSRVELQHDVLSIGIKSGYIKAINGLTITLDELLPIQDPNKEYGLKVIPQSGDNIRLIPLQHFEGSSYTVSTEAYLTGISKGDFYAYGEIDKITEDCIIVAKQIDESPSLSATLTLKAYAPEIFNAETQPIPEYNSKITSDIQFSTDFVYEGSTEELDVDTNGSTVQDNGAIFFSVRNIYVHNNQLYNLGDLFTIGTIDYTCDLYPYANKTWLKGGDGYARFKIDNAMYEDYTVNMYAKIEQSATRKYIAYYNYFVSSGDRTTLMIYTEDNKLYVNVDSFVQEIYNYNFDTSHYISIVCNKENDMVYIYIDGELNISFSTASLIYNLISEDGDNLISEEEDNLTSELFGVQVSGNDRDKYFYLFQDENGNNPSDSMINEFRLYKFAMSPNDIKYLYQNTYYLHNTIAESKYLGEFPEIPLEYNVYDWFYYTGETNVNFLQNHYYRRNKDKWQLYEIYLASINKNS